MPRWFRIFSVTVCCFTSSIKHDRFAAFLQKPPSRKAIEQNRTEQNRTEQNRTEQNRGRCCCVFTSNLFFPWLAPAANWFSKKKIQKKDRCFSRRRFTNVYAEKQRPLASKPRHNQDQNQLLERKTTKKKKKSSTEFIAFVQSVWITCGNHNDCFWRNNNTLLVV